MKWLMFVILTALSFGVDCKPSVDSENFAVLEENSIRLPEHTRPTNYDIELRVNIHNGTTPYSGKVIIKIAVDIETDVITLHNKGLSVSRVTVTDKFNDELQNTIAFDATKDFLFINVDRLLTVGDEYSLEILFDGVISQTTNGFYRTSYRNIATDEIR
jgi:aminopeptidase N